MAAVGCGFLRPILLRTEGSYAVGAFLFWFDPIGIRRYGGREPWYRRDFVQDPSNKTSLPPAYLNIDGKVVTVMAQVSPGRWKPHSTWTGLYTGTTLQGDPAYLETCLEVDLMQRVSGTGERADNPIRDQIDRLLDGIKFRGPARLPEDERRQYLDGIAGLGRRRLKEVLMDEVDRRYAAEQALVESGFWRNQDGKWTGPR